MDNLNQVFMLGTVAIVQNVIFNTSTLSSKPAKRIKLPGLQSIMMHSLCFIGKIWPGHEECPAQLLLFFSFLSPKLY